MEERFPGMEVVDGSNPFYSTILPSRLMEGHLTLTQEVRVRNQPRHPN